MSSPQSCSARPSLELRAKAELERRRRERSAGGLYDFVPKLGPRFQSPRHLAPLVVEIERALRGESLRRTAHAPPRFGKTDTVLAAIVLALLLQPHKTHAYFTYGDSLARSKSRRARSWALAHGVRLIEGQRRLNEWRTPEGGGLIVGGVCSPFTGQGVDGVLFVDDPYKDRTQAESPAYRARLVDWWSDVGETRLEPGSSAFIFHTRWVADDLIGHVSNGEAADEWQHIHMPAISPDGRSLWPEKWPVAELEKKRKRVGEYTWASLFQGTPRARGQSLFSDVHYYDALPSRFRLAIGVDLAYSGKTSGDYSVAVVLAECDGVFYVLEVIRVQLRAPDFAVRLANLAERYPGAPMVWLASGTEVGSADFMVQAGLPLEVRPASSDKFLRAQLVSAAWNARNVLLPMEAPWARDFITEVCAFTGVRDPHDDQVDALAAAHLALDEPAATFGGLPILSVPRRC